MEAQTYRLTCEDAPTVEYMSRFIAKTQQRYTQRGGVRPFGVSSMMAGIGADKTLQLYLTDPAGTFSSWKANCIGGRNEKAVQEFLEKNWTQHLTRDESTRLAVRALLEVVDSGSKNMEIAVVTLDNPLCMLSEETVQNIIVDIERELEEAKKKAAEEHHD